MAYKYICSVCRKEFESTWTDEEAQEELKEVFPGSRPEDSSVVCDDCYKEIMGK